MLIVALRPSIDQGPWRALAPCRASVVPAKARKAAQRPAVDIARAIQSSVDRNQLTAKNCRLCSSLLSVIAILMTSLNPNRTGLVLALLVGAPHLLWALLVALGWAQAVVDFVLWMHFLRPVYSVDPFKPSAALLLVGVSATSGYVTGFVFAVLWNRFHRQVAVPMNSLHRGSGASGD